MLLGKIIKPNRQQQPHKIFPQQQHICKFGDHGRIMELAHTEEETDIVIGECLTKDEAQDIISVLVRDGAVQGETDGDMENINRVFILIDTFSRFAC